MPRQLVLLISLASIIALGAIAAACGGSSSNGGKATATPAGTPIPGEADRVTVSGTLTLDGARLDSQFLGAVVLRDGFVTPCQSAIPPAQDGTYAITVLADTEGSGCGAPGARIVLWASANDEIIFTRESVAWPESGHAVSFDGTLSTATPDGAEPPVAQFFGEVFNRDGGHMPGGTRVEAYVGDVRCGVASTRYAGSFTGYILAVVGPDSVAGCERGATLTFRIDGQPAVETSVNDLERENSRQAFDLTLR
jgi:hypothetical protein